MGLNQKQKEAVEYLGEPLLVLAGPGTGKTQLLSHKVAYILENLDTNPENILCLTFTETGAKNMRERLKSIIGNDALKVNIGTYHAFGSEILAQYKNYSEDYDRKLDQPINEVIQYKIIKKLQDNLPATDILKGDSVKDIMGVISEAKAANLSAKDLLKIAEKNIEDSKVLSEAISPLLKNVVPYKFRESYDNAYMPIYETLKEYGNLKPILGTIERSIAGLARDLKEAILLASETEKIKPLSDWKDKYFEKDQSDNYRLRDRVANKKLLSLAGIMSNYDQYLKKNGLYDFNDMIEEAVKILKDDDGFRMTLQERYQFIMLDEFQDTNPSQFAIVKELTDYENPMIMAVGDDDQAIYEFQGALASNLTDFQKHYSANVIPLIENYRSTQEILDFSHEIIKQAPDRFADKELIAHNKNPEVSQVNRYEFISSDAEYGFVADEIVKLITNGVKQSEIAVISYKTKYFEPLLPFLKAHQKIRIAYEKKDNLFDDEKIHEILTIARFVDEIANEKKPSVQILEILSYPFFKLSTLEILNLVGRAKSEHRTTLEVLSEAKTPKIVEVIKFLADLAAKSFLEPLDTMLDYIIGTSELNGYRSPLLEYYVTENHDEYEIFTFYESLAALRGKITKHFGEKPLRLADLIEMLDDYLAAEMPLNISSPYRESEDAVSVLSAHKAKGLEFSYVFIISADHMAWGKGKGNNNLLSLPKNLIQIRHTGITDGEKLRVLYVALTRAKKALYITNSLRDFNDKSPERLEYFNEYVENDEVISPFLPTKKVNCLYNTATLEKRQQNLKNWLSVFTGYTPDLREIYKNRVEKWRMSATALSSFVDIVYAGPQAFFKSYVLQAPREPKTESLAFGDLVHEVFETVTKKNISDEEALKLFNSKLDKEDLSVEIKQAIREKGPNSLIASLKEFKDILRQGKAEVDFGAEKIVIDGVPVTGKIDHIIIDEKRKTIEIYDFKTAGYHKEKWESHASLYKYMLQLGFYKLLLNHSTQYKKYKVEKAHILFVTPDYDGEVHDKIYEFTEEEETKLKQLMRAVYQNVYSLNFIDDPDMFIAPNEKFGVKDIKKFIELLLAKNKTF